MNRVRPRRWLQGALPLIHAFAAEVESDYFDVEQLYLVTEDGEVLTQEELAERHVRNCSI